MKYILFCIGGALLVAFMYLGSCPYKWLALPLLFLCYKKGRNEKYWFNPFYMMMPTVIAFLIYEPKLAPVFLNNMSIATQIVIVSSLYALYLGMLLISRRIIKPVAYNRWNEKFWVVFFIGLLPNAISFILYGNTLDLSGDDLIEAKSRRVIPFINELSFFLQASVLVACKNKNARQILLSSGLSIFAALLTATKASILITFVFIAIGFTAFNPFQGNKTYNITKKYLGILIPFIVLYLFMFTSDRRHGVDQGEEYSYSERAGSDYTLGRNYSNVEENLFGYFLYMTTSWSNFEYNIMYNNLSGGGMNTFGQFPRRLGIKINKAEKLEPMFFNTHSFLTDFYLDFGHVGAIIASFFLGILICFFYFKFGLCNDAMLLAFYALVAKCTILLFFSNHFTRGGLLNYFLSYSIYYLFVKNIHSKATY